MAYPLQYPCLKNPTGRGAWWATVHGVAKNWTRLSDEHLHTFNRIGESCLFTQECFQNSEAEIHSWKPRQKRPALPSSGLLWSLLEDDRPPKRRRLKEKFREEVLYEFHPFSQQYGWGASRWQPSTFY